MSAIRVDFAVLGATPQARLLAGLLASVHRRSVLYQGESQSGYRLPRGIDLSVAPLTRPETWSLLSHWVPETRKLIGKAGGRGAVSRIDAVFLARTAAGLDALGHMRHMAQAFKLPAERLPAPLLAADQQGVLFRDALFLHRASIEPVLDRWLDTIGVHRLPLDATLVLKPDGSAVTVVGDGGYEIRQTVLADDAAILAHLASEQWPSSLRIDAASTLLTEPAKPLPAALVHQLDGDLILTQHARGGIAALGSGSIEQVSAGARKALSIGSDLRQAGQTSYQRVASVDGAPVVGRLGGTGPDVIAGFGPVGAFVAPALARWLAGAAHAGENDWFASRLVNRLPHGNVAEWGAAS
jgi:hypothetical protein